MTRALYLTYYFPPTGGAGVQRAVKFVRYLPEHGVEPLVLTGPAGATGRWAPKDVELGSEVDPKIEVVRAQGPEPAAAGGWRGRSERWLGRRARWDEWWIQAAFEAGLAARGRVDVILCSMSPFSSAIAAARLSHELGVPWVADLRDPWALDEMTVYPTVLHRRAASVAMGRALRSASAVIMNTATATDAAVAQFPTLARDTVETIPNGFDAEDFAGDALPRTDDGSFRIVHTGYLHTELGLSYRRRAGVRRALGGTAKGFDALTRSHVILLEALERLGASEGRVELHLAGVLSDADRAAIPDGVPVVLHGYLPHAASVDLVRSADLLFLPMHDLEPGRRATIVPGKTYEYLASGRPILAAVPDGDARDLLAQADGVELTRPADAAAMAASIARVASQGARDYDRRTTMAPYERRELARRLADVLHGCAAERVA